MQAQEKLLDDFSDIDSWVQFTSGPPPSLEMRLHTGPAAGPWEQALQLDFDFCEGGGFVVIRKEFPRDLPDLPERYSFGLQMRGNAPPNIFEFKLVDRSGLNVWRHRAERFEFPAARKEIRIRDSDIEFAWGPLGGGPARDIVAIELVVAAGSGGKGTLWIDSLTYRDDTYRLRPRVTAAAALDGHGPERALEPDPASGWLSGPATERPLFLHIDFLAVREYGGLLIHWEPSARPAGFTLLASSDGQPMQTIYTQSESPGERSYLYLPGGRARHLRLEFGPATGIVGIRHIEVRPFEFSRSLHSFYEQVAATEPRGRYPKYLLRRQSYWTLVGAGDGSEQGLMNEEGMVEIGKGACSVEPFVYADGRLYTWADAAPESSLAEGCLPIPSVRWNLPGLVLHVTAWALAQAAGTVLYLRYRLENGGGDPRQVRLFAALRPFQASPSWQHWTRFGGVMKVHGLAWREGALLAEGENLTSGLYPLTPPNGCAVAGFAEGGITGFLAQGRLPSRSEIHDELGHASAALLWNLDLAPGETRDIHLAAPLAGGMANPADWLPGEEAYSRALDYWRAALGRFALVLPASASEVFAALKTAGAHILICRDQAALQPGARRYSRSWIRDGAIMAAALLRLGRAAEVRDFIRWYAGFQDQAGNLPDCVDRLGADGLPHVEGLPEYDGCGEFIYTIAEYVRFSGDTGLAAELWPAVAKAVGFLQALRAQRLTPDYRTPEKRAYYGLLPESMSHEGYMAHPVHAYWDDFWALRGLKDAAELALALNRTGDAARLAGLRDDFAATLYASLAATMALHGIEFLPGSVELGDFDPAASAVALTSAGESHRLPQAALHRTFDRYMAGFRERAGGKPWNNYSPYEIRIIGALVRMGRRAEAVELLEYFLADRRPRAWNQWPEIAWRDPDGPSFLGDLPHAWIAAEYLLAALSLFAYEREADGAVVVAAGIPWRWLEEGGVIRASGLPTRYGELAFRLGREGPDRLRLVLSGNCAAPGGFVLQPPTPAPVAGVSIGGETLAAWDEKAGLACRDCPADVVFRF